MGKIDLSAPTGFNDVASTYYVMDLRSGQVLPIRFPPNSVSENPGSPNFSSETAVGRSNQIVNYTSNSNRSMSVSIVFIDDYYTYSMLDIRNILSSMVYPNYSSGWTMPPSIQLRLGSLVVRGVMKNLEFTWEGVIRSGVYTRLNASFLVEECREIPLGMSEVLSGGFESNNNTSYASIQATTTTTQSSKSTTSVSRSYSRDLGLVTDRDLK